MFDHIADFFLRELNRKKELNPNYSLRAFSRDLGLSPTTVSLLLKMKQGISPGKALLVSDKLYLNHIEKEIFMLMVEASHCNDLTRLQEINLKIAELNSTLNERSVQPTESFSRISDWDKMAVYVLADLKDFQDSPAWIAERLNIPENRADEILTSLKAYGLLIEDTPGRWIRNQSIQIYRSEKNSPIYQKHYLQILEKAKAALKELDTDQRDFSNLMMTLSSKEYGKVVRKITAFRKELLAEISKQGLEPDQVYSLSMQFFPITTAQKRSL